MRHTEVTQTPCQCGSDCQCAVRCYCTCFCIVACCQADVVNHAVCICCYSIPAACYMHTKQNNNQQSNTHYYGLDHICHGCCQETACYCVCYDNNSRNDHCYMIVDGKDGAEQFTACRKTGCCIRYEEYDDNNRCDRHQDVFVISVSQREKVRQSDRIYFVCVCTDSFCNDQPVYICTDGQTDGCPCRFCDTGNISYTGQTHQQPGGHIRCFCRHRCYDGAHFSAAQIKVAYCFVVFRTINTDRYHAGQINANGDQHNNVSTCHNKIPSFSFLSTFDSLPHFSLE